MKAALIALTDQGEILGSKISAHYNGLIDLFILGKSRYRSDKWKPFEGRLNNLTKKLIDKYNLLIYIMPLDVATRALIGNIQSDKPEPDVIVVDEQGSFVISLLCGHLEEANTMTQKIAQIIGGTAVVTDNLEVCPNLNLELLAEQLHCKIMHKENLDKIKEIIVNNGRVDIFTKTALSLPPCDNIRIFPFSHSKYKKNVKAAGFIFITNRVVPPPKDKPYIILVPHNLIVGVECSKWAARGSIIKAIWLTLEKFHLDVQSLHCIAVGEHQADWTVLQEASKDLGVPLKKVGKNELDQIKKGEKWYYSLQERLGLGKISEFLALAAEKNTKLVSSKEKIEGVKIALAEIQLSVENGF